MNNNSAPSPGLPASRWGIVLLLMGFAAIGHFNRIGISVAGTEVFIPKMGFGETQMGWVYSTFLIVYTLAMLPGGWLIDRIGSAHTLTLLGVTMGTFVIFTGVIGWSATGPEGLWLSLLVIRGFAGLCSAPLHPSAAHVVSQSMPARNRATANGMVTAGALIGIAFCFPIFGQIIDHFEWQRAFIMSGSLLVAYGVFWHFMTRGIPTEAPPQVTAVADVSGDRWMLFAQPSIWLLTLSYAAYGYFQYLFFYWMDYYFKSVLHVPKDDARWASFWIMLAQGAGMAVGGMLTDLACKTLGTTNGRRLLVMLGMGLGAVFGLLAVDTNEFWKVSASPTVSVAPVEIIEFNSDKFLNVAICLACSMAAIGMCEGVFWTSATDIGGQSRGLSGAFMNTGGNIGGLISPVLTPMMAERLGWPRAIGIACLILAIGGVVWFAIRLPERVSPAK